MHRFAVAVGSTLYKTIRLRIPVSGLKVLKGDYSKVCAIRLRICVVLSIVLLYLQAKKSQSEKFSRSGSVRSLTF